MEQTSKFGHAGKIRGGKTGETNKNETWANIYKGMIQSSIQNLKALGLWVFFLIYYSTFLFLPIIGLRLTLEYLTISPSSESPFSTLIHSPSSESKRPLTCTAVHTLIWDTLAWNLHLEDFRYRVKLYLPQAENHRLWYHLLGDSEGKNWGDFTRMRHEPTYIRECRHLQPKTLRH